MPRPLTARFAGLATLVLAVVLPLTAVTGTPSASASGNAFGCLPANGLSGGGPTEAAEIYDGTLPIPGFRDAAIGQTGHVDWGMNPFSSLAWQKYFTSLDWLMSLTEWNKYSPSTNAYLKRAEAFATDFAQANPPAGGPAPAAAWSGMYAGQRATVYACLDAMDPSYDAEARSVLTSMGGWLGTAKNDPGDWNQGVDYNIGLLAAGCVVGGSSGSTWAGHANDRLTGMATSTIDSQGAIGEQAPGYGPYLWSRLGLASTQLQACGYSSGSSLIASQRQKLLTFLAWSTEPDGNIEQIGDTFAAPPPSTDDAAGTASDYAATKGAEGTAPSGTTALYTTGGYAFGRSTWSPFASAAYYTLRFGPALKFHGHQDHEAVTLDAFGHQFLVDSGHYGYTAGAYRDYLVSDMAHNVLAEPGVTMSKTASTTLTRSNTANAGWQYYEVSDTAFGGRTRTRDVLVDLDTPFALVYDRASRASRGLIEELWHLAPDFTETRLTRSSATFESSDHTTSLHVVQLALPGQTLPAGATRVVSGSTNPYLGWVSTANNQRTKAPVVLEGRSTTTAGILSVIVPTSTPTASVGWVTSYNSHGILQLLLTIGSTTVHVSMTNGGVMTVLG